MKIFVAYGYNPRDEWVPNLVFPIIRAFGAEVVTGERTYSGTIPDVIQNRVRASDALIGFLTRRNRQWNGRYGTHYWVLQELAMARTLGLHVLEVREARLDLQPGLLGDHQPLEYRENNRAQCVVELVQAVSDWSHGNLTLRLAPREFVDEISPFLRHASFRCTYRALDGGHQSPEQDAEIMPIGGSLFVRVTGIARGAYVQLRVYGPGPTLNWTSDYESPDSRTLSLKRWAMP